MIAVDQTAAYIPIGTVGIDPADEIAQLRAELAALRALVVDMADAAERSQRLAVDDARAIGAEQHAAGYAAGLRDGIRGIHLDEQAWQMLGFPPVSEGDL